jgi:hypothetical protein
MTVFYDAAGSFHRLFRSRRMPGPGDVHLREVVLHEVAPFNLSRESNFFRCWIGLE